MAPPEKPRATSTPGGDSFAALFEQSVDARAGKRRFHPGESLEVTIVVLGHNAVFADLGGKQEGFFERAELVDPSGKLRVEVGSRVTAIVKGIDANGQVQLQPVVVKSASGDVEASITPQSGGAAAIVEGARVRGKITGIERYGVFVQVDGTHGRSGRGLVPLSESATPRGADLKKHFVVGQEVEAKVLAIDPEGKIRLSFSALKVDEDRAAFEAYRATGEVPAEGGDAPAAGKGKSKGPKGGGAPAPRSFGTLGDLLTKKKK